jgi:phytoene desaturase
MPRVCVIGAGFGGLALAVRLQSAGIETVLLEARDKPGGRAYVHEVDGFTFDAGPTVITDPSCLAELFALTGRDIADYVELLPVSPFYRLLWEDGTQFDYSNDEEALFGQIARLSPPDVEGYRRFLGFSEGVWREGYLKLGHTAFLDFKQMLAAAPSLARYQAWRSVYSMVASHIRHPRLREAFSFHTLLVGGDPYKTSSVYALIHKLEKDGGVWFPRGGTHALVRALLRLFTDLGGEVRLNAKVERIEAEGNRVTGVATADGWHGRFDAVASNGDVVDTYARLLGHTPRGAAKGRALKRARFSPSLFVVYFGVRKTYPEVKHHSILFGPRYKGLLRDIYDRGVLAEDFSLYLHHPTATDPAMAPPGCSTFYVLSPVPHLGKAPIDWDVEGPRYRDRILDKLEAWLLPGLREHLAHVSELTPLGFQRNLSAHLGSAFSLEPILTQSAWFRVHNRDDVLKNLYFVGAGTHPGAGIPGVVGSAKATARVLLGDFGLDQVAPTQMRLAAE